MDLELMAKAGKVGGERGEVIPCLTFRMTNRMSNHFCARSSCTRRQQHHSKRSILAAAPSDSCQLSDFMCSLSPELSSPSSPYITSTSNSFLFTPLQISFLSPTIIYPPPTQPIAEESTSLHESKAEPKVVKVKDLSRDQTRRR